MDTRTPKFRPAASVLVVGLNDALLETIRDAARPIQVNRVAHASAALERMVVTQPLVVVFGMELPAQDQADLIERAEAIGADVVRPESFPTKEKLASRIAVGIVSAEQRRLLAFEAIRGTDPASSASRCASSSPRRCSSSPVPT